MFNNAFLKSTTCPSCKTVVTTTHTTCLPNQYYIDKGATLNEGKQLYELTKETTCLSCNRKQFKD